ncbi:MAG: Trk system potassium transporter TrkA [Thermodesulfobacteriota bacterium]
MKAVIVGAGEVGYHIASKLSREKKDVVVIDLSEEKLRRVAETLDVQTIHGSGSSPAVLNEAGLKSADLIVAVTDSDETNLVACVVAKAISPGLTRIARIRNNEFLEIAELRSNQVLGFSLLINPEAEVVKSITRLLEVPGAQDVIDFEEGLVRLIGLKIRPDSVLVGKTMAEMTSLDPDRHILIAAIHRDVQVIIPHGQTRLEAGDLAYMVVRPADIEATLRFFRMPSSPVRSVFIAGGGQAGSLLAQDMERKGIKVKLIEWDAERCRYLSQVLHKAIILRGDATDQSLLEEENIADADVFIALTNSEEENVLACLLAKRLGVRQTITRINKFSYIPLISAIGLDTVVSSRLSAVSAILRHIRKGKVVSAAALKGEDAEVLEFEALQTTDVVDRPIHEIRFPRQALIAALIREGRVIVPTGKTVVKPNDRLIIIARREAIPKVEKALTVKLEYF